MKPLAGGIGLAVALAVMLAATGVGTAVRERVEQTVIAWRSVVTH